MDSSRFAWIAIAAAGMLAANFSTPLSASAADAKGKTVFLENKCNECHTVEAEGIERSKEKKKDMNPPDLSDIGTKVKREWVQKFLQKEETLDGKKHKKKFRGDEAEEKALLDWLMSLKTPAKKK